MERAWTEAPPLPTELQLEITSACNLRYGMCLVRYRPPVNKLAGAMTLELYTRILDGIPGLRRLTLQGLGEPLLSPYLLDMGRAAKARGIAVGFNSNATLLTRRRAGELVAAGLDWLLAAAGVNELRVQNLSHTFSDTDPAGRYAGIRELTAAEALWTAGRQPAQRSGAGGQAAGCTGVPADRAAAEGAFAAATEVAREHGLTLRLPSLEAGTPVSSEDGRPGCTWPWDSAYVTSQGVVQPCCMVMGDDRVALGHLAHQGFGEIWHSPGYREFRRRLAAGDDPPEVCRGCALYQRTF